MKTSLLSLAALLCLPLLLSCTATGTPPDSSAAARHNEQQVRANNLQVIGGSRAPTLSGD